MYAGKFNEIVELYEPITRKNSVGANEIVWEKFYTTRASVKYNNGNRTIVESEVFYNNTKTFILRSYIPIVDEDRIKFQGKFYRVTSLDHRREYNDIEVNTELVNE